MSKINSDLVWLDFDIKDFFPRDKRYQYVLLVKSSKFIDEDFNPEGILFGLLHSPTGNIDLDVSFNTAKWNGSHDVFFSRQFGFKDNQTYTTVEETSGWNIEDIEQYVVVEVYPI